MCVTGSSVDAARAEERNHRNNVRPETHPEYGNDWCFDGFVWRDAFAGDRICVTGAARDRVARENREHRSRTRVGSMP